MWNKQYFVLEYSILEFVISQLNDIIKTEERNVER